MSSPWRRVGSFSGGSAFSVSLPLSRPLPQSCPPPSVVVVLRLSLGVLGKVLSVSELPVVSSRRCFSRLRVCGFTVCSSMLWHAARPLLLSPTKANPPRASFKAGLGGVSLKGASVSRCCGGWPQAPHQVPRTGAEAAVLLPPHLILSRSLSLSLSLPPPSRVFRVGKV